jgi:DHA2 family multidrug resistance protein
MAITIVARREQFHQLRLTEHLLPSLPQYQESLRQATAHFATQGATQPDAQRQAFEWLSQLVQMQSALLSYIDVFWTFAVLSALLIPAALLLLRSGHRHAAPAAH